ncbi:MAG TPA: hypothetical protein VJ746_07525 [Nitrospira sp.]|nr:hypothetical protein [Nitrospira sp.]
MNIFSTHALRGMIVRFVLILPIVLLASSASAVDVLEPDAATPPPAPAVSEPAGIDPLITLRGSVWRTKAGIVFLKTPVGILTLSSKSTFKDLKASHEVLFWVHERHSVVEIRRRNDGSLVHRYLTGPMTFGEENPKTLHWWTADGEEVTHFGTQEERLGAFHEGDPLTVEVDESHTIVGVHDLQYDLQISQAPPSGSEAQLFLSGTVSKIKSNFVFFKTPVGLVMVNAKIGVPRVKVGQPLSLRIDNQHVTVELKPATTKSSRNSGDPIPSLATTP